ncbi:hypothetical protein [Streptomyces sp. BE303]|uniref:hypothetical protein n=1 Tax=Streptomyces sp. BE303 TaxID=3002528 RepID=UPI002E79B913|nr:hypothetical protein [Streptomyces sp. BE303]MED7950724.1 hypothetical protein [Streptomyces sp. BE303]
MSEWTVLVVEDNDDYRKDIGEQLRNSDVAYGAAPRVILVGDFSEAGKILSTEVIDVVVLDVRDDTSGRDDAGELLLEELKLIRFVPVVFFTAYAERVAWLAQDPVVQVVGKDEHTDVLVQAVRAAFESKLPVAVRGLLDHVREVVREYLWDDLAKQWGTLSDYGAEEKTTLLVARLVRSLELTLAVEGESRLSGPIGRALAKPSKWHPSRIYVLPPMGDEFDTGDLLRDAATGRYWVQLTPSCDLANGKAERHLLVSASPVLEIEAFRSWRQAETERSRAALHGAPSATLVNAAKNLRGKCKMILLGKMDRFFHLPKFITVPDLLVDLQHVQTPAADEVGEYERVAGLASPWPQVLVNRFNRQVGRMGFDDPDADAALDRIFQQPDFILPDEPE